MSFYAIAIVRDKEYNIGIRIINKESYKCKDISQGEINFYKSRYGIDNISISSRGNIKWDHGASERYPIIDMITGEVRNRDNVIVLAASNSSTPKKYIISNYNGDTILITNNQLLDYCTNHKLSNAKVVQKKGQDKFIAGIGWTIEELQDKPTFKFNADSKYLEIDIPLYSSDTLVIPNMTPSGRVIEKVMSIKVTPQSTALKIRKLILENGIHIITYGVLSSMPNLEEIEAKSDQLIIYNESFVGLKNLRKVRLGGVKLIGNSAFTQLKKLETVEFGKPLAKIPNNTFNGCINLDVSNILVDGVTHILYKAFAGLKNLKEITLPSSLIYIDQGAFNGCNQLEAVNCLSESLDVGRGRYIISDDTPIFINNPNKIIMYIGKHMRFNGTGGANVELVVREETDRDKIIDKRIRKGNMIGTAIDTHKKFSTPEEVAKVIGLAKPSEVKQMVDYMIKESFDDNKWERQAYSFNVSGIKIDLTLPKGTWVTAKSIKDIGKVYVLKGTYLTIIPYDLKMVRKSIEKTRELMISGTGVKNAGVKGIYTGMIYTPVLSVKYVKSIKVADNGMIRVIYNIPDSGVKVVDIHDFES